MTKNDIIDMARDQGLPETATEGVFIVNADDLGRLMAAEREACAKICDARYMGDNNREDMEAKRCAIAIRARSNNT